MARSHLAKNPDVIFDFNLPHTSDVGFDHGHQCSVPTKNAVTDPSSLLDICEPTENAVPLGGRSNSTDDAASNRQNRDDENLDYRQFPPGFSDDEDTEEVIDRPWVNEKTQRQCVKAADGKKSPRRSDEEGFVLSSRKRSRPSLFGGRQKMVNDKEQVENPLAPATPSFGIGNRLFDLNLDQQLIDNEDMVKLTKTGLELACSDIGSVCDSPIPSDDECVIPPDTVVPYKLRQNIDRNKAITHLDNDNSGNWNPEHEAKERATKLLRAKAAKKGMKDKRKKNKKTDKKNESTNCTVKCIARLRFDAFDNVRNKTNDEQNWPDVWSDLDSEQERDSSREAYRRNTPECRLQSPLNDPSGDFDNLTRHPAARGCKNCHNVKQVCSMTSDGNYPCKECVEDNGVCQPIQEPATKSRCMQCYQAQEAVCSFEKNPTQISCGQCTQRGHICEPLPPNGYVAPRIDMDKIAYGPNRLYAACTTCRAQKKRCSLKRKDDKPPCKNCKKHSLGCTFYHLPKPNSEKPEKTLLERIAPEVTRPGLDCFTKEDIADMNRRNTEVLERQPTPELEMEDSEGNRGMLTKITTSFAHPIGFGVAKSSPSDCNFCDIPLFGMVGHFEKEVHVIRWYSGLGYAEVGGGHCQNIGVTTMCTECTIQRLQILLCPRHELERIPNAIPDHDALLDKLIESETGGADMQYQLSRWCSICFSPASFGCTTRAGLDGAGQQEIEDCHLRLCASCEMSLRIDFGHNFDQMAAAFDSQRKISEADEALGKKIKGRARADVGLLMQDGLLMRHLLYRD